MSCLFSRDENRDVEAKITDLNKFFFFLIHLKRNVVSKGDGGPFFTLFHDPYKIFIKTISVIFLDQMEFSVVPFLNLDKFYPYIVQGTFHTLKIFN